MFHGRHLFRRETVPARMFPIGTCAPAFRRDSDDRAGAVPGAQVRVHERVLVLKSQSNCGTRAFGYDNRRSKQRAGRE